MSSSQAWSGGFDRSVVDRVVALNCGALISPGLSTSDLTKRRLGLHGRSKSFNCPMHTLLLASPDQHSSHLDELAIRRRNDDGSLRSTISCWRLCDLGDTYHSSWRPGRSRMRSRPPYLRRRKLFICLGRGEGLRSAYDQETMKRTGSKEVLT